MKFKIPARMVFWEGCCLLRVGATIFHFIPGKLFLTFFFILNMIIWDNLRCQTLYLQTWSLKFCCILYLQPQNGCFIWDTCEWSQLPKGTRGNRGCSRSYRILGQSQSYELSSPQFNMFVFSSSPVRWVRTLRLSFPFYKEENLE